MINTWTDQRDYLISLIKEVTEAYGEELDKDYADDIVLANSLDLGKAIQCFENLRAAAKVVKNSLRKASSDGG